MSTLLQVNNVNKSFLGDVIFNNLSLSVSEKQKIGVVGRNGAGKSTLFKMIVGLEEIDAGSIQVFEETRIGYLSQHSEAFDQEETVLDFLQRRTHKEEWQCAKLAHDFQIKKELLTNKIGSFAGGYQMRIKLIELLLHEPNLLLLDEPTNFLDLSTVLLLEQFLQKYTGSFLLISHDREFIKRTCKQTIEIEAGKAIFFPNEIERYFEHKAEQLQLAKRYNKKIQKEQRHLQTFVDRFRSKASKASQAQSKIKQIERLQQIEIAIPSGTTHITIPNVIQKGGIALAINHMSIGYGSASTIAKDIDIEVERGKHIAIVGNNGQGKTTLLKTIAGELASLSGSFRWGPGIKIGYYAQHVPLMLKGNEQVLTYLQGMADKEVREEDILRMAGNFLFKDHDLKKPVSVLSGGEKARLCLAGLLLQKNHVLLLDEPSNHLDFETVEALGNALQKCNATVLFISHNRTFVNQVADAIVIVHNKKVLLSYHGYEHYVSELKKELEIPEEKIVEQPVEIGLDPEIRLERKLIYEDIKKRKKSIEKFELEMEKLEKTKKRLENWFKDHPTEYSESRQKEFAFVQEEIQKLEEEWFGVQEEIGRLEWELSVK